MMVVAKQSSRHKMWTKITRPKYEREGQRYASDLTDAEWALIEPYMPAVKRLGRPRETELRAVLDAILRANRMSVAHDALRISTKAATARDKRTERRSLVDAWSGHNPDSVNTISFRDHRGLRNRTSRAHYHKAPERISGLRPAGRLPHNHGV